MNPFGQTSFKDRTFKEEADYWLADKRNRFSASHQKRVDGILAEIMDEFGRLTIDRFSPQLLAKFQQRQKSLHLENATVNRKTEVICAILNFSASHVRIPFNPTKGFKKLESNEEEMLFWERDEATSFLSFANLKYPQNSERRWIFVVYLCALSTAIRSGEIWGLKVKDDLTSKSCLFIRRQFNRVELDFTPTKGKSIRKVPANSTLQYELKQLEKRSQLKTDDTYFRNKKGLPVCHENFVKRVFQRDLKEWGGRKIRFHDLRHTATTLMIAEGIDLYTVSKICGHEDIETTMGYAHLLSGAIGKVADSFTMGSFGSEVSNIPVTDLETVREVQETKLLG